MGRIQIILATRRKGDDGDLPEQPGKSWRFKSIFAKLIVVSVLIGLLVAAIVLGYIIATLILILFLMALIISVVKSIVGDRRPR